jgi:beta-phosphoglucomutase-like phosphatase (HAD superfamily)
MLSKTTRSEFEPEAIIFDMDGLLIDSERPNKKAWQGAAAEMGHYLSDEMYHSFIGRGTDECESVLKKEFGESFSLEEHRNIRRDIHKEVTVHGIRYLSGVVALVSWLYDKNIPMALATSSYRKEVPRRVGELLPYLVTYSGREDAAHGKPEPDLYQVTAEKMNIDPARILVLEDSNPGVEAAYRAGMKVIMVPDMLTPTLQSEQYSLFIAENLVEVRNWLRQRIK